MQCTPSLEVIGKQFYEGVGICEAGYLFVIKSTSNLLQLSSVLVLGIAHLANYLLVLILGPSVRIKEVHLGSASISYLGSRIHNITNISIVLIRLIIVLTMRCYAVLAFRVSSKPANLSITRHQPYSQISIESRLT